MKLSSYPTAPCVPFAWALVGMIESNVEIQTSASFLYQLRRLVNIGYHTTLLPTKNDTAKQGEHYFHLKNQLIIASSQGRDVKKRGMLLNGDSKN